MNIQSRDATGNLSDKILQKMHSDPVHKAPVYPIQSRGTSYMCGDLAVSPNNHGSNRNARSSSCCFSRNNEKSSKPSLSSADSFGHCCAPAPPGPASALTCLGVCIIVLMYTTLGAFLFLAVEGTLSFQREETSVAASKPNLSSSDNIAGFELRTKTVEKLWSITEDLNILYKENWTRLAARELMDFQRTLVRAMRGSGRAGSSKRSTAMLYGHYHRWTFSTSFLYSLTLITTIGYGNVTPRTTTGKLVTIAYAFVGIPLVLLYLSTTGDALARSFRAVYAKTRRSRPSDPNCQPYFRGDGLTFEGFTYTGSERGPTPFQAALNLDTITRHYHPPCPYQTRVPILLCIIIIGLYIAMGGFILNKTENWSLLESSYFCFTSLGTIGFGDLYPGSFASNISPQAEDIAICICCAYIIIGMAVVAMCFNLIQVEVFNIARSLGKLCGGGNTRTHAARDSKECESEEISMAIVS